MASLFQRVIRKLFPPGPSPVLLKTGPVGHVIYSFVIDADPRFVSQGFYLAKSLMQHAAASPADVHVQLTADVSQSTRDIFLSLGCTLHNLPRFGDGKYCNKVGQLNQLLDLPFDHVVLMDTDMIVVEDFRPYICRTAVLGKAVDVPIPSQNALRTIAGMAGMSRPAQTIATDVGRKTFLGNCNGGFYVVPKPLAADFSQSWRKWALWLLDNKQPLIDERKTNHVDQVSFWLAIHIQNIPFEPIGANLNYFCHVDRPHLTFDPAHPIFVLHYHDGGLGTNGQIQPIGKINEPLGTAVTIANRLIEKYPLNSNTVPRTDSRPSEAIAEI